MLLIFHNRSWYAPDDGTYAHIAQRLLSGEVLNSNIQDHHPGYIHFVNAAALSLWGLDLVSLRYPIVFISMVQALLIFLLLVRRNVPSAIVASIGITTLGFIQFANPTAHWYSLFLAITVVCMLQWLPEGRTRLLLVGAMLGFLLLFRHFSGLLVGTGAIVFLFLERSGNATRWDTIAARLVIVVLAAGLGLYLTFATNITGVLLLGIWPLAVLLIAALKVAAPNREVIRVLMWLGAGALIASLPLIAYHLVHGSSAAWLSDMLGSTAALPEMTFTRMSTYIGYSILGLQQALVASSSITMVNGLYWFILPLVGAVNGLLVIQHLLRSGAGPRLGTLPIIAVFYGVVALHHQVPVYLYFTTPLSVASILWLQGSAKPTIRLTVTSLALFLCSVAVFFHAGQPITRPVLSMLNGVSTHLTYNTSFPKASLWLDSGDIEQYERIIALIQHNSNQDDTILAIPSNSELYFLSHRFNRFRFRNTAFILNNSSQYEEIMMIILNHRARLIVIDELDKYNTVLSRVMIAAIKREYVYLDRIGRFDVYSAPSLTEAASG